MTDDYTKAIRERLEKADGPYHIRHINESVDRAHTHTDIATLLEEREVLREALKEYSNPENYEYGRLYGDGGDCDKDFEIGYGQLARDALAWKPSNGN